MKLPIRSTVIAAFGLLSALLPISQTAHAQGITDNPFVAPAVFQAAGPTAASIQSTVDAYRAALGNPNNGNNPGPLQIGRREINWDGGNPNVLDTTPPVTPFNVFLNTRGSRFTTPGIGLSQAPPAGGPQGGLAVLFNNPDLCQDLQGVQPVAVVHSGGKQRHRRFLLRTRYRRCCDSNGNRLRRGLHRR